MFYWKKINWILIVLLIVFLIPSIYSLLLPGFIVTDDATWMVVRFSAFFDSLKDGQIPVRVLERINNGYGYPVANFLYPGFMYLATIFHVFGLGFVDSIKGILITSMLLSGYFTYFWLKKLFDPIASFVGALLYVYAPYHLFDLYKRGSVGEILGFVWVPFILWQIERKSIPFAAFGIFMLFISHNSLALITLPLIFLYALIQKKLKDFLILGPLGILMSSFFIIPAIFELNLTKFPNIPVSNPYEYFADLSLVGLSTVIVMFFILIILFMYRKTLRFMNNKLLLLYFFVLLVMGIFFSSEFSSFFWKYIPSQYIQFPFRLLSIQIFSLAFLGAYCVSKINGRKQLAISFFMIFFIALSAYPYWQAKQRTMNPDEYYSTNQDTTTVKDEYLPKWVKVKPDRMPEKKVEISKGSGEIAVNLINSRKVDLNINNISNATIRLNYIYYPGWKAYLNREQLPIQYDNDFGVMDVKVDNNNGNLVFVLQETPLRYVSNILSVLALIFCILLFLRPILKFK